MCKNPEKCLIIHTDDWGLHPAVNQAIENLYRQSAITSASLLSGGPAAGAARSFAKANPTLCVGVHLSLSADIPPVSLPADIPSLLDPAGRFHSPLETMEQAGSDRDIFRELRQQVEFLTKHGIRISHLDCHQGCVLGIVSGNDSWLDNVWVLCRELAIPFKLPRQIIHATELPLPFRNRMSSHLRQAEDWGLPLIDDLIVPAYPLLPGETYLSFKQQILEALRGIKPGTTVELTLHPALPDELLCIADPNWVKREWEYRLCLDDDFHKVLHEEQIRLTSWRRLCQHE